ncbi:MAG: hypothetical protein OER86_05505 [Phycisphaerae bacterium]|nr:hypothetical protein [Phycisphaerae bacterium]
MRRILVTCLVLMSTICVAPDAGAAVRTKNDKKKAQSDRQKQEERIRKAVEKFKVLDLNRDRKLSVEEFISQLGGRAIPKAKEQFARKDLNKSGALSFKEFYLPDPKPKAGAAAGKKKPAAKPGAGKKAAK